MLRITAIMARSTRVLPITRNWLITGSSPPRVGDSYDNALAEAVNGLYKAELIYSQSWASLTEVEFATLNWVHWWNNERLHEALEYRTPADIIDMYNQTRVSELTPV